MNVLMLNYEYPPLGGGGGVACYHIARELAKNHHVEYITTGFKGLPKFEIIDGISVHRVPVLGRKELSTATFLSMLTFFPSSLLTGIKLCRKNKYEVINAHFVVPSGPTGIALSKIFGIPIVMSVHGGDIYDPSKKWSPHRHFLLRKLIKWLLNNSDRVTAQSNNTKSNIINYYKFKKRITIIPLGFTKPKFKEAKRKELGFSEKDILLISVGRLIKRKAYQYAIRAVSKLPYQNIKYLIIGDGPEEDNLRKLAKELKVDEKVEFLGFVLEEKKFQYLSISDIYLLSSLHEGFGICLLEAMYCSLPIVATNNGGQTDFLVDQKNTFLVTPKDSKILAEKIVKLIENKEKRLEMSTTNRNDILNFYIEEIAKQYVGVYEKVINNVRG